MSRTSLSGVIGLLCVLVLGGQVRAAEDPGLQVDALHAVLEVFASQGAVHEDFAADLYSDGYAC